MSSAEMGGLNQKRLNPLYWFGCTTSRSGISRFLNFLGRAFSTSIAKSTLEKIIKEG